MAFSLGVKPPSEAEDDRLEPGAYVSKGASLYRVQSRRGITVDLEDAYLSHGPPKNSLEAVSKIKPMTVTEILRDFLLVSKAA
jgi:hypothetical protein